MTLVKVRTDKNGHFIYYPTKLYLDPGLVGNKTKLTVPLDDVDFVDGRLVHGPYKLKPVLLDLDETVKATHDAEVLGEAAKFAYKTLSVLVQSPQAAIVTNKRIRRLRWN